MILLDGFTQCSFRVTSAYFNENKVATVVSFTEPTCSEIGTENHFTNESAPELLTIAVYGILAIPT